MNTLRDVLDNFHSWLKLDIVTPHPENKLYVPSQAILKLGSEQYLFMFRQYFDSEIRKKYDFDWDKSMESVTWLVRYIEAGHKKLGMSKDLFFCAPQRGR